jgi:hypothetical protein
MLNFVAKLAIQIGLSAANMALTMSRKIEGPRLDDLKFTSGDYGNPLAMVWGMRRVQTPIFWAEDLKEVKEENKTKGGKYNSYKYYGTWAVALAGHEIQTVRRVWFDTHLVFDLSGAGPVTLFDFGQTSSGKSAREVSTGGKSGASSYFAIYTGTETQDPDPRIQATTEAKHGEGSCPAYRGTAYIVFKDIPLEKLGNRIPQVAVEFIANAASTSVPTQQVADPVITTGWNLASYSPDFSRLLLVQWSASYPEYEIWDVAARAPMIWGTLPFEYPAGGSAIGVHNDGTIVMMGDQYQNVYQVSPDGLIASVIMGPFAGDHRQFSVRVIADATGAEHWIAYGSSTYIIIDGAETALGGVSDVFADAYGDIWALIPNGYTVTFVRIIDGGSGAGWDSTITITLPTSTSTAIFGHHTKADIGDRFIFGPRPQSGTYYNWVFDPANPSTVTGVDVGTNGTNGFGFDQPIWDNIPPGAASYWVRGNEISLITGDVLRTAYSSTFGNRALYDPINHAIIENLGISGTTYEIWHYLDRQANNGVTLGTIATALADMVDAQDTDFTALDQVIQGWSATQGQASAILEPLLDTYDSDIRPHEFTLQGLKRTGTSDGTLLTERFVGSPRYEAKVRQSAELPRAVTINFADLNADQQPNNVRADRPLDATGARGEKSIDLSTLAIAPDPARDLADRYFRRIWNERKEVSLGLTAQQLALEPGDVRTLDLDGEQLTARLTKVTIKADDSLATEWVYDHSSLALLNGGAGAAFDGRDPSVIVVPLISKGFVLDVPLLTDAHNSANPIIYLAAGPYATGTWPGATVYQQLSGGEYSDEIGSIASTSSATWGYANAALPDANPNLWDRASSLNVTIQTGTLTGCTEADIDALPTRNLALIGDELVNFTTATLESDGTYTLSGFKRGRRGTEWATGTHASRDVFLLLSHVATATKGLSDVGTDMSFKAVTSGRTAASAFPIPLAPFTGASLKPYAPCHLAGVKDSGSGDWALSWVRRTRVGGAWTSGTSIPLGEASEEYEVEIMNGGSVVRTVTGLTSTAYTYSAANQTSDFGSGQSSLNFRVYQISDSVGRGFVASATV